MNFTQKLLASILCIASMAPGIVNAAELTVNINGIASDKGKILVALYDKADVWMKRAIKVARADAKTAGVAIVIKDLQEGDYAVSIYHDENDNGKFDTNALGMPIEPFSFSNDASGNFGPPTFEQAKFKLDGEKKAIVINFK
jgi:uncharacterized protein (DUF2141 family)